MFVSLNNLKCRVKVRSKFKNPCQCNLCVQEKISCLLLLLLLLFFVAVWWSDFNLRLLLVCATIVKMFVWLDGFVIVELYIISFHNNCALCLGWLLHWPLNWQQRLLKERFVDMSTTRNAVGSFLFENILKWEKG